MSQINPQNNEPPKEVKRFLIGFAIVATIILVTLFLISPELRTIVGGILGFAIGIVLIVWIVGGFLGGLLK